MDGILNKFKFNKVWLVFGVMCIGMSGTYAYGFEQGLDSNTTYNLVFAWVWVLALWALCGLTLPLIPGFEPKPNRELTRQEFDKLFEDFYARPSTKLKLVFAPITLWYYVFKAVIRRVLRKFDTNN
jgi:hypothetical protein